MWREAVHAIQTLGLHAVGLIREIKAPVLGHQRKRRAVKVLCNPLIVLLLLVGPRRLRCVKRSRLTTRIRIRRKAGVFARTLINR